MVHLFALPSPPTAHRGCVKDSAGAADDTLAGGCAHEGHSRSAPLQPLPAIFTFDLTVIIPVCITLFIQMRKVKHASNVGHESVDHLKPTLPEVDEGLIAIICIAVAPHFSSVFNLLRP